MPMMTSEILKVAGFTKVQKSRHLENETFFLQIKKFLNYFMTKNSFVAEVTFKVNIEIRKFSRILPDMKELFQFSNIIKE